MTQIDAAFVLAAGLGTRMQPLSLSRPKPLISLAGKTLIDHALDRLSDAGVTTAAVNVHYLADQLLLIWSIAIARASSSAMSARVCLIQVAALWARFR